MWQQRDVFHRDHSGPRVEGHPRPEVARGLLQWSRLGVPCILQGFGGHEKETRSSLVLTALTVGLLKTPEKDSGTGQGDSLYS